MDCLQFNGQQLLNLLNKHEIVYNFKRPDITDQAVVNEKISALKPEVIYHCAAYTAVDNAEDVAKDLNWQVNADGTRNVAEAAKKLALRWFTSVPIMSLMGPMKASMKLMRPLIHEMNMVKLNLPVKK